MSDVFNSMCFFELRFAFSAVKIMLFCELIMFTQLYLSLSEKCFFLFVFVCFYYSGYGNFGGGGGLGGGGLGGGGLGGGGLGGGGMGGAGFGGYGGG